MSRLDKAQKDYEAMVMNNNQLAGENLQKMAELKSKDEEIGALKKELSRVSKIREALQRKLRLTEEQKMESEQRRENLRQQILGMERGMSLRVYIRTLGVFCMLRLVLYGSSNYFVCLRNSIEIDTNKKQAEADRKAHDDLVRERDSLNKVHTYVCLCTFVIYFSTYIFTYICICTPCNYRYVYYVYVRRYVCMYV